jgi:signal transduction histidine kinase
VNTLVRMNRGRLLQVLDNLVRNSVYWLRRGVAAMNVDRPKEIRVKVVADGFILLDSGPGVDPAYEESIFEMFVTAKPAKERGQGLGLFIVTQLLAADGCEIYLGPERNKDGNRNRFVVNLGPMIEER